jgi:hypothetical protein
MRRSGQKLHSQIAQEFCPRADIHLPDFHRQFRTTISQILCILSIQRIPSNPPRPFVFGFWSFLCHLCLCPLSFRLPSNPPRKYLISRGVAKFPAHPRKISQSTFPSQVLPFTILTPKIFLPSFFRHNSAPLSTPVPKAHKSLPAPVCSQLSTPDKHTQSTKKHIEHVFSSGRPFFLYSAYSVVPNSLFMFIRVHSWFLVPE